MSDEQPIFTADGEAHNSEFDYLKNRMMPDQIPTSNADDSESTFNFSKYLAHKGTEFMNKANWFVDMAKGPGDAYAGNLSPEDITATGVRMGKALLEVNMMLPAKPGSLGTFGARVTKQEVADATHMEENIGGSLRDIKEFSGLERSFERRWLYEIDDSKAQLNYNGLMKGNTKEFGDIKFGTLGDFLDHPKLYERYPEAKDIDVILYPFANDVNYKNKTTVGYFKHPTVDNGFKEGLVAMASDRSTEEHFETLMHEVQHYLQRKDNRASEVLDNMPANIRDQAIGHFLREAIEDEASKAGVSTDHLMGLLKVYKPDMQQADPVLYKKAQVAAESLIKEAKNRTYRALRGEVEARNVEARLSLTEQQRRMSPMRSTEDVFRSDQIHFDKESGRFVFGEDQLPKVRAEAKKFKTMEQELADLMSSMGIKPNKETPAPKNKKISREERESFVDSLVANPEEKIDKVAVLHKSSGKIEAAKGVIHLDLIDRLIDQMRLKNVPYDNFESGFLTTGGHFVNREEAFRIADRANQVGNVSASKRWESLSSEDVYNVGPIGDTPWEGRLNSMNK